MAGTGRFPPFFNATANGLTGHPIPGANPTVPLNSLLATRANSFALVFSSGIDNTDSYADSAAPTGFSLVGGGNGSPRVFSEANIPQGSLQINVPWGIGADIWSAVAIGLLVSSTAHVLAQSQFGGATLAPGFNSYTLGSAFQQGNTCLVAIQISGAGGGGSALVGSVSDNLGNVYKQLAFQSNFQVNFNQNQQIWLFACRGVKAGVPTITIGASGSVASGTPSILEYGFV